MKTDNEKKLNLITQFNKLFCVNTEGSDITISEQDRKGYIDKTGVCMIVPKKKHIDNIIKQLFDVEEKKIPVLDYLISNIESGLQIKAKYSTEYLKIMYELCKHYERITFSLKNDYPLSVECEDFIFILAPCINTD